MQNNSIKFSIIIPSYNEGDDVRLSIESALNQKSLAEEILVIDDSTDGTLDIVKEYQVRGVQLVKGEGKGCCGARNLGMKIAKGDVAVLLNADVVLPEDFLDRVAKHYEAGADFVLVEAEVFNQDNIFARFIEAQHKKEYGRRNDILWSEGFSCRTSSARKVGLIPGDFKVTFCRDWFLGKRLENADFKKVIDRSIVVRHKAPDNFKDYFRVRKARGRFSSLTKFYILERSHLFLFFNFIFKDLFRLLCLILIFPFLINVLRITLYSERGIKDFFGFVYTYFIQNIAFLFGEWQGFFIPRL